MISALTLVLLADGTGYAHRCSVFAPPAEFRVDGCELLIVFALEGALEAVECIGAIARLGFGSGETDQRIGPSRV
jgi:hypothetical protein